VFIGRRLHPTFGHFGAVASPPRDVASMRSLDRQRANRGRATRVASGNFPGNSVGDAAL